MMYTPKKGFSHEAMISIPQKVAALLTSIEQIAVSGGVDLPFSVDKHDGGNLEYDFTSDPCRIALPQNSFEITWEGPIKSPTNLKCSEKWAESVENNLSKFVEIEVEIYSTLEDLETFVTQMVEMHLTSLDQFLELKNHDDDIPPLQTKEV